MRVSVRKIPLRITDVIVVACVRECDNFLLEKAREA